MVTLTDTNFDEIVLKSDKPVLVDFWAEWCGPCRILGPMIEEIAKKFDGKAIVGKLDVDTEPHIAARYGIRNIPTVLFFDKGNLVHKQVGVAAPAVFTDKLQNLINIHMADKKTITYKFPSGAEVTGTLEEIVEIAKALKTTVDFSKIDLTKVTVPKGYYPSESKGLIKVSDMGEWHLRRALLKRAKEYYAEMFDPKDTLEQFLNKFTLLSEDQIITDLFTEIKKKI